MNDLLTETVDAMQNKPSRDEESRYIIVDVG